MNELHRLIEQRGAHHEAVERERAVVRTARDLADALDACRTVAKNAAADRTRTAEGQRAFVRTHIHDGTCAYLRKARSQAKQCRDDLATWTKRLVPAPGDKGDLDLAVIRSDIRAMFRGMTVPQQVQFLAKLDHPVEVYSALLSGPAMLSGISEDQRGKLLDNYRSQFHAGDMQLIAQQQEAIALLDAVSSTVANEAARTGGWQSHEFSKLIEEAN
ncbi:hypothetical protein [Bradyrhizobium sp. CCBAU 45389]|uniref:hypothetical protein n=1 Tax=Bradyrhizobium sp. CCBAU 45389 TaxID=858429 RepID=UPI00230596CF|nr:hypothetical protein [Bradyrhizobium sp. CCBAU 45389]